MKKILIIKIGAIGDVIMSLPMIDAIRNSYEVDSEITWIVGKGSKEILKQFDVDKIIDVDENKLLNGCFYEKILALIQLWIILMGKKFDYVYIPYYNWKYQLIVLFTRSDRVYTLNSLPSRSSIIPGRHLTYEYVRMIDGIDNYQMKNYKCAKLNFSKAKKMLVDVTVGQKVIALAPGGAKNVLSDDDQRRWPIEQYVMLAKILIGQGHRVIITGAKSDKWVESYFNSLCVDNYVGKTSIIELAYLFSEVDVVVTHDSGPMHIAGLVHANLIALFGPTNPYEKVPKNENAEFIWLGDKYPCCPCYNGKTYAMCCDNKCLSAISPEIIVDKLQKYLES